MLTIQQAIDARVSCRAFDRRGLEPELLERLGEFVQDLNAASGLHFTLYTASEEKSAIRLARSMFPYSPLTCLLLTGAQTPEAEEQTGYFGQRFVLHAARLGLGTCWVAGTYDHHSVPLQPVEGESVLSVIPVGYPMEKTPLKQQMIRSGLRRGDRSDEAFVESEVLYSQLPDWFRRCVEAVRKGPSAVNGQPVNLTWRDGEIHAKLWKTNHRMEYLDLGIAKAQFQAAAAAQGITGRWNWGDGGQYLYQTPDNQFRQN